LCLFFLRYTYLLGGCFALSLGIALLVKGSIFGVGAWTVFHLGLTNHLPMTLGQVTLAVGVLIIILSALLGVKPRIGTLLNMTSVGIFLDLIPHYILGPEPVASLAEAVILVVLGNIVIGFGTAWYMSADLGQGPRDSLMVALTQRSGFPVGSVRTALELSVLVVGYFLGGPVGLGTVVSAVVVGPSVEYSLNFFRWVGEVSLLGQIINIPVKTRLRSSRSKRGEVYREG